MKKSTAICLIFIYTLSVIGLAVNKFYCCGKLESVSFLTSSNNIQAEKDTKTTGCCKNEKKSFKVKDSHVSSETVSVEAKYQELAPLSVVSILSFDSFSITEYISSLIKGPPRNHSAPFFILNCIFRI